MMALPIAKKALCYMALTREGHPFRRAVAFSAEYVMRRGDFGPGLHAACAVANPEDPDDQMVRAAVIGLVLALVEERRRWQG